MSDSNSKFMDAAWYSVTEFSQGGRPSFYYLDEAGWVEYHKIATQTPIGHRITYGVAEDEWANNFALKFVDLDHSLSTEKNEDIREVLEDISFYTEFRKARAYDLEQGESLVFFHRTNTLDFDPDILESPANESLPVVRVEAIHWRNYTIDPTGKYYHITFTDTHLSIDPTEKRTYKVHVSHCVRFAPRHFGYYINKSTQSAIKPVLSEITIAANIEAAMGDAAFRWGNGKPLFWAKNVREQKDIDKIKNMIGNPDFRKFLVLPVDRFEKVEMLGLSSSHIDLPDMLNRLVDFISMQTKIPRPILMGEVVGVVTGSEVNERSYYAKLDQGHSEMNPIVKTALLKIPQIRAIIGDAQWELDWGLRQVMSKEDQARFNNILFTNANLAVQFSTWNEVRRLAGLPPWEEVIERDLCLRIYGFTPEEMGVMAAITVQTLLSGLEPADLDNPNAAVVPDVLKGQKKTDKRVNSPLPSDNINSQIPADTKDDAEEARSTIESRTWLNFSAISARNKNSLFYDEDAKSLGLSKDTVNKFMDFMQNFKSIEDMRRRYSINAICKKLGIGRYTFEKLMKWVGEYE